MVTGSREDATTAGPPGPRDRSPLLGFFILASQILSLAPPIALTVGGIEALSYLQDPNPITLPWFSLLSLALDLGIAEICTAMPTSI